MRSGADGVEDAVGAVGAVGGGERATRQINPGWRRTQTAGNERGGFARIRNASDPASASKARPCSYGAFCYDTVAPACSPISENFLPPAQTEARRHVFYAPQSVPANAGSSMLSRDCEKKRLSANAEPKRRR